MARYIKFFIRALFLTLIQIIMSQDYIFLFHFYTTKAKEMADRTLSFRKSLMLYPFETSNLMNKLVVFCVCLGGRFLWLLLRPLRLRFISTSQYTFTNINATNNLSCVGAKGPYFVDAPDPN